LKTPLEFANFYGRLGFSLIPIKPEDKRPALSRWGQYQKKRAGEKEINDWFSDGKNNIGIVCGKVSGNLVALDFDDPLCAHYCFNVSDLAERTPVGKTGHGIHIYGQSDGVVKKTTFRKKSDKDTEYLPLDIQAEGSYVVAPPSIHPDGRKYEFLKEFTGKIIRFDYKKLAKKIEEWKEEWPIIERILPEWKTGNRQNLAMGLVGFLRKRLDYDLDRVTRMIEGICRATNDSEVQQRTSAVKATFSKDFDDIAIKDWLGAELSEKIYKILPQKPQIGSNMINLSDSEFVNWTPTKIELVKVGAKGNEHAQIVIDGYVRPIRRLIVDNNIYFDYELANKQKIFRVDELLKVLKSQGQIFYLRRASDVVSAISQKLPTETIVGHATFGVYSEENGLLKICENPVPVEDVQLKSWDEISDFLTLSVEKKDLQHYIEILDFWHPYEILPALGLGLISPFTPILRNNLVMVPHYYAWAPEHDLGKSLVSMISSTYLWGISTISGPSLSSPYRFAAHLDAICLSRAVEECDKLNPQFWPVLKDSAERWLADKRGSKDLTMRDYLSRAVFLLSGNEMPIKHPAVLKRFLINRFDSHREGGRRSSEVDECLRRLKPIGFQLLRWYLEDFETEADFLSELRSYESILRNYSLSWKSPKRPEAWACVYVGLRILETGCRKTGHHWRVMPIDEFFEKVIEPVEESTWELRRSFLEGFVNWFDIYRAERTRTVDGRDIILGENETFVTVRLKSGDKFFDGFWVTGALTDRYNQRALPGENVPNLKELSKQSADLLGIPYDDVLEKDGNHAYLKRIGGFSKRVAFIPRACANSEEENPSANANKERGNPGYRVTEGVPEGVTEPGYADVTGLHQNHLAVNETRNPCNQPVTGSGYAEPDRREKLRVTLKPESLHTSSCTGAREELPQRSQPIIENVLSQSEKIDYILKIFSVYDPTNEGLSDKTLDDLLKNKIPEWSEYIEVLSDQRKFMPYRVDGIRHWKLIGGSP